MNREITYSMQRGMVDYFMNLLNLPRGDVWAVIKDACHKCVDRLDNNNKSKSWCYADIPGCDIRLRVDVFVPNRRWRYSNSEDGKEHYRCEVKFSNVSCEDSFTEKQVEEYIVEKIILGD